LSVGVVSRLEQVRVKEVESKGSRVRVVVEVGLRGKVVRVVKKEDKKVLGRGILFLKVGVVFREVVGLEVRVRVRVKKSRRVQGYRE